MADRDFYEVLGLTPAADGAAIDTAYWQLARRYQAEAVHDPRASAQLDELNEAYNVLGVPYMRADYDAARREALASVAGADGRKRRRPRRERAERPSIAVPVPVVAAAAAAVLLLGAFGAAWWAGYGVTALVVALFFGAGAAGAYLLLGNADAMRERLGGSHPGQTVTTEAQPVATRHHASRAARSEPVPDARPARVRPSRHDRQDAGALQASVASTRERWRRAATAAAQAQPAPDTTLVEIFSSEREIESKSEPLSAVMEILRGARAEEDTSAPSR